jgi:hypothetical protein
MLSAVASAHRALVALALAVVLALLGTMLETGYASAAKAPGQNAAEPLAKKKLTKKQKARERKRKKRRRKRNRGRRGNATTTRPPGGTPAPPAPGPTAPVAPPQISAPPPADSGATSAPPPPPPGPRTEFPLWQGGFETGNFSQWKQLNGNLADRDRYFGIVPNPAVEGRYSFRSTVDGNAREAGQAGQRSMVLLFPNNVPQNNTTGAYEGSERWYRTAMYFPADFNPSPNSAWNWLVQWHNWPDGPCCSNLAISVDARRGGEKLSLRVMGGGDQAHPVENNDIITERNPAGFLEWFVGDPVLRRNHWYDSLVHVKWSADPSKGFVEWWLDGRRIVSRAMPTLYWYADNNRNYAGATPGPGQAYYMEGYYRPNTLPDGAPTGPVDTSVETVYFDGAQIGKTAPSVAR